jgi:hypothetical protein
VEQVETGNADANEHMIAVNETLGFKILQPSWSFLELPVAAALANKVLA